MSNDSNPRLIISDAYSQWLSRGGNGPYPPNFRAALSIILGYCANCGISPTYFFGGPKMILEVPKIVSNGGNSYQLMAKIISGLKKCGYVVERT